MEKVKFLADFPVFVQLAQILFQVGSNLYVRNSLCSFIWCRWIMKKIFTKIRWIYRRKTTTSSKLDKNSKIVQKIYFFWFSRFFYADLFSEFLCNFFSWFTYTIWTNTRSSITTDWNQPEIIFQQVGQKLENRPKIWLFTIFFTPIYSTDFFETFFHGSPTPYERTQGVSYLQIETNQK